MARRPLASTSVMPRDFVQAYEWIKANYPAVRSTIRNPRPFENIQDFIENIISEPWDHSPGEAISVEIVIQGLSDRTTESLASDVRKYLHAASAALGFERILNVRRLSARRFMPYWEESPHGPDPAGTDGPIFSSIAIFGKSWPTEFSADFMRGMYAMARELGLTIADYRSPDSIEEMGEDFLIENARQLDPAATSVFVLFDNSDQAAEQAEQLKRRGFHVAATGHRHRSIAVDDDALVERLAGQCIADQEGGSARRIALVLARPRKSVGHDYGRRTQGLKRKLRLSGRFDLQEEAVADTSSSPNDITPPVIAAVEEALRRADLGKIAAIFPRLNSFTKIAVRYVHADPSLSPIRIYGERISAENLAMLSDPQSPLAALCGVDPYYYGRYAIRVASTRHEQASFPAVPPFLVTKQEALRDRIFAADRIPPWYHGCDVRLCHRSFAWFDWMRERCPASFGPDQPTPGEPNNRTGSH